MVCLLKKIHSGIHRTASTLGYRPPDIVKRAFAQAGFTMEAIGGVGELALAGDLLVHARVTKTYVYRYVELIGPFGREVRGGHGTEILSHKEKIKSPS
jgi:hypothetical protein